ncbi:MAG: S26 family signal peptidase [Planctomycetota bacterium]|jgi:type IV secretory pathway protease TraF
MNLETAVLDAVRAKPLSGGKVIERLQAEGANLVPGRAVLVYGALANLRARGAVAIVAESGGEAVWGVPGTPPPAPAPPGFPPSFSLGAGELALIDRELARRTRGLPARYFEELRRVVVADADRRVFNGEKLPGAVTLALEDLGAETAVRGFLKRVERGGPVPLRLRAPTRWRWLLVPAVLTVIVVILRLWFLGVYTVPADSISMAPTLVPAPEGGDALVLASLYAGWSAPPRRGEVWVLELAGDLLVKRVMGLPDEVVSFRKGDLFIGGRRLVKERALLDRLKVPLFQRSDFERTDNVWRQNARAHSGWRGAAGEADPHLACRDVVVTARLRAAAGPATVTFALKAKKRPAHTLLLKTGDRGFGEAAVGGLEVARGSAFRLRTGREIEVWLTNADRVYRVEIDGREIVRAPVAFAGQTPVLTVATEGQVDVLAIDVARDLIHEAPDHGWRLGEDQYFVLGDNSGQSRDSRVFGPIGEEALRARVLAVAWPPSRMRSVR